VKQALLTKAGLKRKGGNVGRQQIHWEN